VSVRLSVPSIDSSSGGRRGLLLGAQQAGDIDRQLQAHPAATAPQHGAEQQTRAVSR